MRFLVLAFAGLFFPQVVAADVSDTAFSDAEFVGATSMVMSSPGAGDMIEVFVWVYRSALGQQLNQREATDAELGEIRRLCQQMRGVALASDGGAFGAYFLEFVHGRGPVEAIRPSRRAVFAFFEDSRCNGAPTRVGVQ